MLLSDYIQRLYRTKPGYTMNIAVLAENKSKNRYHDVLPCMFSTSTHVPINRTYWVSTASFTSPSIHYCVFADDANLVRLKRGVNGDYCNASHVNVEVADTGIITRSIATQGPLPHTAADFWQMCFEQNATLIVMLTQTLEKGRVRFELTRHAINYFKFYI